MERTARNEVEWRKEGEETNRLKKGPQELEINRRDGDVRTIGELETWGRSFRLEMKEQSKDKHKEHRGEVLTRCNHIKSGIMKNGSQYRVSLFRNGGRRGKSDQSEKLDLRRGNRKGMEINTMRKLMGFDPVLKLEIKRREGKYSSPMGGTSSACCYMIICRREREGILICIMVGSDLHGQLCKKQLREMFLIAWIWRT